jgi:hypothetical protein
MQRNWSYNDSLLVNDTRRLNNSYQILFQDFFDIPAPNPIPVRKKPNSIQIRICANMYHSGMPQQEFKRNGCNFLKTGIGSFAYE